MKREFVILAIVFLFLLAAITVGAHFIINLPFGFSMGEKQVVDAETGLPISYANVTIVTEGFGIDYRPQYTKNLATDSNGYVANISNSKIIKLLITHPSYHPFSYNIMREGFSISGSKLKMIKKTHPLDLPILSKSITLTAPISYINLSYIEIKAEYLNNEKTPYISTEGDQIYYAGPNREYFYSIKKAGNGFSSKVPLLLGIYVIKLNSGGYAKLYVDSKITYLATDGRSVDKQVYDISYLYNLNGDNLESNFTLPTDQIRS